MAYSSDLNTRLVQYTDHGPLFSVQIVHYSEQEQPNFNVVYVGSTGLDLNFGLLSSVFKSIGAPIFRRKKSLLFECLWYLVVQSNAPVKGLELFSIFYIWAAQVLWTHWFSSHKSSAVLLSLFVILTCTPTPAQSHTLLALACTAHGPLNEPAPSMLDYHQSLTHSFALKLCSFPRLTAALCCVSNKAAWVMA